MDITEDQSIYPVLAELSACLCKMLGEGAPCFCGIVVGEDVPFEYVGQCADGDGEASCGVAYVRVMNAYPTENFPEPQVRVACNAAMAYSLAVGVLRCASIGEEDGGPVDPVELQRITLLQLGDMQAIRKAIMCCLTSAFPEVDHIMGTFVPFPMEGGVAGGEWPVTVLEQF